MSNTPHTPGPWVWKNFGKSGLFSESTKVPILLSDARILEPSENYDTLVEVSEHAPSANARLIAASPDLLAACKLAYSILPQGNAGRDEPQAVTNSAQP